jgi:hypothetical protein
MNKFNVLQYLIKAIDGFAACAMCPEDYSALEDALQNLENCYKKD